MTKSVPENDNLRDPPVRTWRSSAPFSISGSALPRLTYDLGDGIDLRVPTRTVRLWDWSAGSAELRGARFQAVFASSDYVETGWNLWGMLPHLLPQQTRLASKPERTEDSRMSRTGIVPST